MVNLKISLGTVNYTDFLRGIASAPERILLLDYDGTLAPFHIRPELATLMGLGLMMDDGADWVSPPGLDTPGTIAINPSKGLNECKGQGGCKGGDAGCAGKNSCKGKGGCKVPVDASHHTG